MFVYEDVKKSSTSMTRHPLSLTHTVQSPKQPHIVFHKPNPSHTSQTTPSPSPASHKPQTPRSPLNPVIPPVSLEIKQQALPPQPPPPSSLLPQNVSAAGFGNGAPVFANRPPFIYAISGDSFTTDMIALFLLIQLPKSEKKKIDKWEERGRRREHTSRNPRRNDGGLLSRLCSRCRGRFLRCHGWLDR
jgi:hypothetical protein